MERVLFDQRFRCSSDHICDVGALDTLDCMWQGNGWKGRTYELNPLDIVGGRCLAYMLGSAVGSPLNCHWPCCSKGWHAFSIGGLVLIAFTGEKGREKAME